MTIKTQELKKLLNLKEDELKNLTVDQLRILLGVSHYLARLAQREINERLEGFSVERKV